VPGGVVVGIAYWTLNLPLASRGAAGPKPSGGNSTSVDVSCAASSAGQPLVSTMPAIVTESPGAADAGTTLMSSDAAAGSAFVTVNTPVTSTKAVIRLTMRRVTLTMPTLRLRSGRCQTVLVVPKHFRRRII